MKSSVNVRPVTSSMDSPLLAGAVPLPPLPIPWVGAAMDSGWLRDMPRFPSLFVRPPAWLLALAALIITSLALCCTLFRDQLATAAGLEASEFVEVTLSFASIPIVSVAFTYVHIWLALWMTVRSPATLACDAPMHACP